jgi:iron complex outermembrane receptor protein
MFAQNKNTMRVKILLLVCLLPYIGNAQTVSLKGRVMADTIPLAYVSVTISGTKTGATTNSDGYYQVSNIPAGSYKVNFSALNYERQRIAVTISGSEPAVANVNLTPFSSKLNEVVITGVSRGTQLRKNPVPIVTLSKTSLDQNTGTNIIDAM